MKKKWSRKFNSCVSCGTVEKPYLAKGMCSRCYYREKGRNPERIIKHKKYRQRPEVKARRKEYMKEFHTKRKYNPVKRKEQYIKHKQRHIQYYLKYRKTVSSKISRINSSHTRRAIYAQGDITTGWLKMKLEQAKVCPYCYCTLTDWGIETRSNKTIEHIVPISKNGRHVKRNVIICCWDCNRRKRAQSKKEFLAILMPELELSLYELFLQVG